MSWPSASGPTSRVSTQLTEDPGIDAYDERKRELRRRAASDGHATASIFTADKLASARQLNASGGVPDPQKLEHYERTVNVVAAIPRCRSCPRWRTSWRGSRSCRLNLSPAAPARSRR